MDWATRPRFPPGIRPGPIPLSFSQERLWFLDQLEPNSPVYNIPLGLRIKGTLNVPMLRGAWKRSCGATNRFGHASKRLTGARLGIEQKQERVTGCDENLRVIAGARKLLRAGEQCSLQRLGFFDGGSKGSRSEFVEAA